VATYVPDNDLLPPGALLRDVVLPALGLSVSQAARDLAISRQTLHRVLSGAAAITPEMAARLERFCGVPSRFWLNRQHDLELSRAEVGLGQVLGRIQQHLLPDETRELIGAVGGAQA
jgi:antitoxin HigA-1